MALNIMYKINLQYRNFGSYCHIVQEVFLWFVDLLKYNTQCISLMCLKQKHPF